MKKKREIEDYAKNKKIDQNLLSVFYSTLYFLIQTNIHRSHGTIYIKQLPCICFFEIVALTVLNCKVCPVKNIVINLVPFQ